MSTTTSTTSTTSSTYDYSNINAFSNSDAVGALNGSLITKLRQAEEKAVLQPIEDDLEEWDQELEKITEITEKTNDLLTSLSSLDLYTTTNNAFEQFSASNSGTSAIFNAVDTTNLTDGVINVNITQLAYRDVYQSDTFSDETALVSGGQDSGDKITLTINGTDYDFSTVGETYDSLAYNINQNENFIASVEQVGDSSYRLIIKSAQTGTSNAISISQTGVDLGLETSSNHILTAQNLQATVDGVSYDIASNTISLSNGISITAVDEGESSLSIQRDTSMIVTALNNFVEKYNDLVDIIDGEVYNAESPIYDKSTLSMFLSSIKSKLYGDYGSDSDKNIFNYGFSLDKQGHLSIDADTLGDKLTQDFDGLKELFIGTAENEGLGTQLQDYVYDQTQSSGLLGSYIDAMSDRKTALEEERDDTIETLDAKYGLLADQFIKYGAIIAQMETTFNSLKMMIEQSYSKN